MEYKIFNGDCVDIMKGLPDDSIDAIITDPPYPCIKRLYGYWTEDEWMNLMQNMVYQGRRLLRSKGSMILILQSNSEKVGSMRNWLWKFMVWVSDYWNIVQDLYWWNISAIPTVHTRRDYGLCRPSLKNMVWIGNPDCYRNQDRVLWSYTFHTLVDSTSKRALKETPSGWRRDLKRMNNTAVERGGSSPYNVLPIPNTVSTKSSAGGYGHAAGTPLPLIRWLTDYISDEGDTILDPFAGSGSTGLVALEKKRNFIGIEISKQYCDISIKRIEDIIDKERQV